MKKQGLLLVDPNPIYREVLAKQLVTDCARRQVSVVAVARAQEALDILGNHLGHWTVVLDIQMPGLSGLAAIKAFGALEPVDQVVCLSALDEKHWGPRTVRAGAALFLSKHHSGKYLVRQLIQLLDHPTGEERARPPAQAGHLGAIRLTGRQREVLRLVAQGQPNQAIAATLEISEAVVKTHIHQISQALRVFNRHQAARRAQQSNLI